MSLLIKFWPPDDVPGTKMLVVLSWFHILVVPEAIPRFLKCQFSHDSSVTHVPYVPHLP